MKSSISLAFLLSAGIVLAPDLRADPVQDATKAYATFAQQAAEMNLGGIFGMLPAAYQTNAEQLFKLSANTVGEEIWTQGRQFLYSASATAVKRSDVFAEAMAFRRSETQQIADEFDLNLPENPSVDELQSCIVHVFSRLGAIARSADWQKVTNESFSDLFSNIKPLTMKGVTDKVAEPPVNWLSFANASQARLIDSSTVAFPFGNADDDGEKKEIIFKCVDGKWIPAFLDFSDETTARLKNAISSVKFTDAQRGAVLTLLRSLTNSANEFGKAENRHMLKSIAEQQKMPIIMAFMLMGSAFSSGDGEGLPANFSLPF